MTDTITLDAPQSLEPSIPDKKWLRRVRAVWFVLIGILFITFLDSIPGTYRMLMTVCETSAELCPSWAQPTPQTLQVLAKSGISLQSFAIYHITLYVAVSVFFWGAGFLVLRYRSQDWHGLLVSYLLITLGAGGVSFVFGTDDSRLPDIMLMVTGLTVFPMYLSLSLFFQTFPDGRIYPRWARLGTVLILANYVVWVAPGSFNILNWSPILMGVWLLVVYGFHVVIQGYRYRYYYGTEQRQQTKWLVLASGIALVTTITFTIFGNPSLNTLLNGTLTAVGFYLPIAVAITIAILRYNLWDIDIILNRTLVYGVLTAILVGVYALIVSTLSLLINVEGNFVVSLLGAGVVAVLFQPLRTVIQRAINRLMFGQRDEPLSVMVELGKSLEMILSPEAALTHLVETTATTLKLPYVAIEYADNQDLVSSGKSDLAPDRFPLIYQAQHIGTLLAVARSPNETLNTADRLLLENVARQASNVVYASRLAQDLQRSRQQILTTREEERRRLRRDLHDGMGPALATLTLQAEAAREWLQTNPAKSEALLGEIISGTQNTLADIRRIVYALRPPALDDLGLVPAIREQAAQYTNNDLLITVEAPEKLPPLPAAVEVAVYRITQEALTNVTRHAQANSCKVRLSVNGKMDVEVSDDGIGIPATRHAGVGLSSIYERAAELGGSCLIQSSPGEGTRVKVSLPRS